MSSAKGGPVGKRTLIQSAGKHIACEPVPRVCVLLWSAKALCCYRSLAEAGLDTLDPDTADQARFIIQAQDLIDPERKGQHQPLV